MGRQLTVPQKMICQNCDKECTRLNWNQRFCDACRLIRDHAHAKRSQKIIGLRKKRIQKLCKHCYSLFKLNRGDRDYCTRLCYRKANKILRLEKRLIEIQLQIKELRVL